jgi:hypothetical protein
MKFKLNQKIVSTLYYKGHIRLNRKFLIQLFENIIEDNVPVDEIFITRVKNDMNQIKKNILNFVSLFFS